MIADGALQDVEAIFAVHVSHQSPSGTIGSRSGPLLAGCGFFRAVISAATPDLVDGRQLRRADTVLAASAAVISLQGIVSREANPLDSQVIIPCFYLQQLTRYLNISYLNLSGYSDNLIVILYLFIRLFQ